MSLFTSADLIASIPEASVLLATDDTHTGAIDQDVVTTVEADARIWISGYLDQAGITMPVPPPSRLKHIAIKYAEYCLWRRRGGVDRATSVYDEWIKPAMHWLEALAAGKETLTPSGSKSLPVAHTEPVRTYTPGSNWA